MARLLFERLKVTPGHRREFSSFPVGATSQTGALTVGSAGRVGAAPRHKPRHKKCKLRPPGLLGTEKGRATGRLPVARPGPDRRCPLFPLGRSPSQAFNLQQALGAKTGADFRRSIVAPRPFRGPTLP